MKFGWADCFFNNEAQNGLRCFDSSIGATPKDICSAIRRISSAIFEVGSAWTNGVPNMKTYNPVVDDGRVLYSPEQVVQRVPHQAGEVSTMVGGRPNWNPDDPLLN